MRAYVGVTDNEWFQFLKERRHLDEINFWQPSGNRLFRTLRVGDPFLFKLHTPYNFIVGGGFFTHASILPVSLAWDSFGEKNGVSSLSEMRRRIEHYRRIPASPRDDYPIGCILLLSPFYFERADWMPAPSDFHLNTVQGKGYDLTTGVGLELWERISVILAARRKEDAICAADPSPATVYGNPVLVKQRLGQGTFRVWITDAYQRRCAVTGEKALPVLDAAHIKPVSNGGMHRLDNGMLLRSDIHTLFDRGYVTVSPEYHFHVSDRLRRDFNNGENYFRLNGKAISLPTEEGSRPGREFLEWHSDTVFLR
jgi:putative restriction endonuclease